MRHGMVTFVAQHKYLLLNAVLVVAFIINTALLAGAGIQASGWGDLEGNGPVSRIAKNRTVKDFVQQPRSSGKRWIIVNLRDSHGDLLSTPPIKGTLSFLDDIEDWSTMVVGPVARLPHGCSTCQEVLNDSSLLSAIVAAINQGAKQLYIMTSVHDVKKAIDRMRPSRLKGLVYTGSQPFKPCSHFVQPLFGTNRSFGDCFDRNWSYSYQLKDFPERHVIGTCPECDKPCPEFDHGRIYCDSSTPNVAVQTKSFSQSTFENSMWTYDSFLGLFFYLLQSTSSSQTEALRLSYVAQRLLWETNLSLIFVQSHDLNVGNYGRSEGVVSRQEILVKVCREKAAHVAVEETERILQKWTCRSNLTMAECLGDLARELYNSRFLSIRQFHVIQRFLTAIASTSYVQPSRKSVSDKSLNYYFRSKAKSVYFWPSVKKRVWSQHPFHDHCSKSSSKTFSSSISLPTSPDPRFHDIVLIIIFKMNDPATQIQMAKFFDYIYGLHFRHIIYCATGTEMIEMFAKIYPQPMTTIDLKAINPRIFPYACVSEVMKMYQGVKGYLQLDSRTLLNPWSISKLVDRMDVPWFSHVPLKTPLSQHHAASVHGNDRKWSVWKDARFGKKRFAEAVEDLTFISKMIAQHLDSKKDSLDPDVFNYLLKYNGIVKQFFGRFDTNSTGDTMVHYGESLIFFVPAQYRENFIVISEQFCRYTVHSDLMVPTLLKTLDPKGRIIFLTGNVVRHSHTSFLTASFQPDNVYMYPWQMSMISSPTRSKFMCETYLPLLQKWSN